MSTENEDPSLVYVNRTPAAASMVPGPEEFVTSIPNSSICPKRAFRQLLVIPIAKSFLGGFGKRVPVAVKGGSL
jgi:hypothetical protein